MGLGTASAGTRIGFSDANGARSRSAIGIGQLGVMAGIKRAF